MTIYDVRTGETQEIPRSSIRILREGITDQEASANLGLASLVAWRMGQHLPKAPEPGRVVSIDGATIYISLGSASGTREGDVLDVHRLGKELRDPVTGEVLGEQKRLIASLKVFEVGEKYAKARAEGELEIELNPGDVVEPAEGRSMIAVFPLTDEEGRVTKGGLSVAESLTSELVARGATVVERTKLLTVVAEQAIGQMLDAEAAQGFGRQLGAGAVIVGTVVDGRTRSNVNLRLVETATGKILYAASLSNPLLNKEPVRLNVQGRTTDSREAPAGDADSFTHAFDLRGKYEQYLDSAKNAEVHREDDGVTAYWSTVEPNEEAEIVYKYDLPFAISTAEVYGTLLDLKPNNLAAMDVSRDGKEWHMVASGYVHPPHKPIDISSIMDNSRTAYIRVRLKGRAAQFLRTNPDPLNQAPNAYRFHAQGHEN